jgi:hypothetical protein
MGLLSSQRGDAVIVIVTSALSISLLVKAIQNWNDDCGGDLSNLRYFALSFACVNIVGSIIKVIVMIMTAKGYTREQYTPLNYAFAVLGVCLIGLAIWGSIMTFPPTSAQTASDGSCYALYGLSKTICILTWIIAPIVTFKRLKARGCFDSRSDEEGEDQKGELDEKDTEDAGDNNERQSTPHEQAQAPQEGNADEQPTPQEQAQAPQEGNAGDNNERQSTLQEQAQAPQN